MIGRPVRCNFGVITGDVRVVEREVVSFLTTYAKHFSVQSLNALVTIRVFVDKGGFLIHNSPWTLYLSNQVSTRAPDTRRS